MRPDDEDDEDAASASGSDQGHEVQLGFAEEPECPHFLRRHFFPSKVGGEPAWLDPVHIPRGPQSRCAHCGAQLSFLMQIYAPLDDDPDAFHRTLFVFTCDREACIRSNLGVRVFRCQLPRANAFYGPEPAPEDEEEPPECGAEAPDPPDFKSPWRELELYIDVEPDSDDEENAAAELSEGASNGAGAGGEEDDGITEADLREVEALVAHAHDEQWASFQSRLARAPTQCVRYCREDGATPLWPTQRDLPPSVPPCPLCDGPRRFEFQILPQILFYAGVDRGDANADDLDFSSIAVFTCACTLPADRIAETGCAYAEEFAWAHVGS